MSPAFRNEYTGAYYHVGGDCATASNKSITTPKKGRLILTLKESLISHPLLHQGQNRHRLV